MSMRKSVSGPLLLCAALFVSAEARPQQPPPPMGPPINLEQARRVIDAAEATARKNKWTMAIAVLEPDGSLVYFRKMDGTQYASPEIAIDKGRSAALFRRPSKDFAERVAKGDMGVLALRGANWTEGGVPIVAGGRFIGAIGVSGSAAPNDHITAQAGADALK
jgi:uncharacterized protein GlcG (DUF336 family)